MVRYVVVGGGVAGVCCVEELCRLCPRDQVILVSPDKTLKGVSTISRITKNLEELTVEEKELNSLPYGNFEWIQGISSGIDIEKKEIILSHGARVPYDKLCICAGAQPKRVSNSPRELALRDTQSVEQLCSRLPFAKTVMIVGNGGIALELIHALRNYHVVWVMRHGHIGDAFFDLDAAQFLLEQLKKERQGSVSKVNAGNDNNKKLLETDDGNTATVNHSEKPTTANTISTKIGHHYHTAAGHAVGPTWIKHLPTPQEGTTEQQPGTITLEHDCQLDQIIEPPPSSLSNKMNEAMTSSNTPPAKVTLTNGHTYDVDLILAAAGVVPVLQWVPTSLQRATDGGLVVNRSMQTSCPDIYAAGDSCTIDWNNDDNKDTIPMHWFQMRLWSQARATGVYAAHCMAGVEHQTGSDMAFELFTHVTRFLGHKVVFLGLYNGQGLENEPHEDLVSYSRSDEGPEEPSFVRVVLLRGRVQGAIMIGETDLEETFENLILDQLDVGQYGPHLLDPDIELDHVFD